ncbi:MAG: hypothetical protein G01um101448_1101 [Parcubacteria group bacterium Gr01-1014_48]|nr:MAG: hypothetical protein Greene041614_552 [Parcubacteria group bacterium Greene0416_14]TSC71755.1 MAG: hypothetical protein G01um101448_1101 [Parcubacteria group bacterium Gr01-1014_48]TSD00566.1 MAG: hypothetical protein Greene101415_787 [Parcubacteria group bacterium Greene1014_15]TSD08259.1 MAG: hypothetical protein Greene07144_241 [Parcubacteria group bacterium Greene0714_4]
MQLPEFTDLESAQEWVREMCFGFPRICGELMFVIARIYKEDWNDMQTANCCARKAIELFDLCLMNTLLECAALFTTVLGKALPSYIHQDFVRHHFPNA